MLKTTNILREELKKYKYPDNKIARMIESNELIQVRKGLYETDGSVPGYVLAGAIYGHSYLSFEYALSYYGLIPERVEEYTSATYGKRKVKYYENHFGRFSYRDVQTGAFPWGISLYKYNDYYFQMASPEKALCDTLSKAFPTNNLIEFQKFMFDDLRIDRDEFSQLSTELLRELGATYRNRNIRLLLKFLEVNYG